MHQQHPPLYRNRSFVLIWCAYFISAAGDHLSEQAILKTQHALQQGVDVTPMMARMTFLFFVPFFLFGPVMGYFADRFARRILMITADIVRMVIMASFGYLITVLSNYSPAWGPFIPITVVGVFAALFSPARSAMLPTLISREQLVPANALIRAVGVIATVLSAGLGGYLADHYHPEVAFRLDALTFLASAVAVFFIVQPSTVHLQPPTERGMFEDLFAGLRYVFQHKRVRQLFAVGTVFWFSAAAIRAVVPALVKDTYHRTEYMDVSMFQVLLALGMVLGAGLLTLLGNSLRSEIAITWSLATAGLGSVLLSCSALVPLPTSLAYILGAIAIVGVGVAGSALIASYNALLQRIVPDRYRGRVYGVFDVCTIGGLLLASGLLGIPKWERLDRAVGYIIIATAALLLFTGILSLRQRLLPATDGWAYAFAANLNEFICRFWYRLKRQGPCTIPRTGPVIVTANHTCSADPLLLSAACRHRMIAFMIAREFSNIPVARRFVRLVNCIPVNRDGHDSSATRQAMRHLRNNSALGIFIQGRIAKPGEVPPPKDGVALLALRTGATVIPAYISGTRYTESVTAGFFVRHRAEVRFGHPVDLSDLRGSTSRENVAQATARIFEAIRAAENK